MNTQRTPSYRLHKATGQGYVELSGRRLYLGRFDKPETKQAYHRTIATWLANGKQLPVAPAEITIIELVLRYWRYAEEYYRAPNGEATSSRHNTARALKPLREQYGDLLAVEFGPNALRALRQTWIEAGLSRNTIRKYTGAVKRMFKWGAARELIPVTIYQALTTLEALRYGRSGARETEPVKPVPQVHIDAALPFLSRQVAALVRLQLLSGARPSELLFLRLIDIDLKGKVWSATIKDHKGSWRQKARVLLFGPKSQEVLRGFLDRPVTAYLFDPREAEEDRHAQAKMHRRPAQKPNAKMTDRIVRDHYDRDSYRKAIYRACDKAGIPHWNPYRLRHNAGTEARKHGGLESAQLLLGHARADVTQVYAEVNQGKAIQIAQQIG